MKEACEVMRLTADCLYEDGLIDAVIPEPGEGLRAGIKDFSRGLKSRLTNEIKKLLKKDPDRLTEERYRRFRNVTGGIGN